MLRNMMKVAAGAVAAGALALGTASAAQAGDGPDYDPSQYGGVSVLSDLCVGNWSGSAGKVLNFGNTSTFTRCSHNAPSNDAVRLGSNICALNWDWDGGFVNGGNVANYDDFVTCSFNY
jgi:hypothetical protein